MRKSNLVVRAGGRAPVVRLLTSTVCAVVAAVAFLQTAGAQSQTATISLSPQDTFINVDASANSASPTLNLYTWPDYQSANAVLMKFNLSSLPTGAVVQQAVLRMSLVQADTQAAADYTISAHKMVGRNPDVARATGLTSDGSTPWTPSGCCYNGTALAQSDISGPYSTISVGKATGAYAWTITNMVREWLSDPSSNYGLLLNADAMKPKDSFRYFASMENPNAALRPVLQITYSAADVTPPAVSMTSPSGGAALSGMATLSATASDQSGVAGVQFLLDGTAVGQEVTGAPYAMNLSTTGIADGTHAIAARARDVANNTRTSAVVSVNVSNGALVLSPADTTLNLNTSNYSTATTLATYTWPDRSIANAIVLKFNLPTLPTGTVIQSATLQMALVESDGFPEPTYTVTAHKILSRNVVIPSATGYSFNGVSNWTPSTCCNGATPMAQSDISTAYDQRAIDKSPGFKTWTLTNLVQEWVTNPASNFGVLLNSDATKPKDRYRYFASMENPNASLRPSLQIQYSGGTGSPTPPAGDTTPPTVTMTAPGQGATVSGALVPVTATASDNVGVVGVQFMLDGAILDSEKTTPPYYVGWNTTGGSGQHTLAAVARDAAGNRRTSSTITVTISNGTTPPSATPPLSSPTPTPPATTPSTPPPGVDSTPPTVTMTAPGQGATVSGSLVPITATASDNVGVVGVQFYLDGAILDSEKTTPPYYVGWNTTGGSGQHTLAAVARDAAGNRRTSSTITVTISTGGTSAPPPTTPPPSTPPPSTGGTGLAARYPGDVGIENDPAVVFVEKFEESTFAEIFNRWGDVRNGPAMVRSADVPAGSPGHMSLSIPWVGGGVNSGGHLYKLLAPGFNDTLYVRYYIKYPSVGNFHHTGIWMGGNNPGSAWPDPGAGSRPSGSDRFIAAAEQNTNVTRAFDHYDYWMNMRSDAGGAYWGDLLLNNQAIQAPRNQWMCVEQMVKLNNPVSASNGEHAIWINDVKVSHLGPGFPNGSWSGGIFTQGAGSTPFQGFQWRSTAALNINYIWLQNYSPDDPPGVSSTIMFDHVVVATSYIGCLR